MRICSASTNITISCSFLVTLTQLLHYTALQDCTLTLGWSEALLGAYDVMSQSGMRPFNSSCLTLSSSVNGCGCREATFCQSLVESIPLQALEGEKVSHSEKFGLCYMLSTCNPSCLLQLTAPFSAVV